MVIFLKLYELAQNNMMGGICRFLIFPFNGDTAKNLHRDLAETFKVINNDQEH